MPLSFGQPVTARFARDSRCLCGGCGRGVLGEGRLLAQYDGDPQPRPVLVLVAGMVRKDDRTWQLSRHAAERLRRGEPFAYRRSYRPGSPFEPSVLATPMMLLVSSGGRWRMRPQERSGLTLGYRQPVAALPVLVWCPRCRRLNEVALPLGRLDWGTYVSSFGSW